MQVFVWLFFIVEFLNLSGWFSWFVKMSS